MAKKKTRSRRSFSISPLNPSIHFILFLALAFLLVIIVAVTMQQVSSSARARLICPQSTGNSARVIEELSARCPIGVEFKRDANNCPVWVCKAGN